MNNKVDVVKNPFQILKWFFNHINLVVHDSKTHTECQTNLNFHLKKELKEKKTCIGPN
jgi:hypothetical protein